MGIKNERKIPALLYILCGAVGTVAALIDSRFYPPNPINPIFLSAFLVFGLHLYGVKKAAIYGMFLLLLLLSFAIEFYYLLNAQLKNAAMFLITLLFVGVKFGATYFQRA